MLRVRAATSGQTGVGGATESRRLPNSMTSHQLRLSCQSGHGGSGGEELAPGRPGSGPGTRSGRAFSTTDAPCAAGRCSAYP